MKVELLHNTPLWVADFAISKCYNKKPYEEEDKQQARINRVANVSKHSSTIEHLYYSFDIDGVSRALLQELARHRVASYTVKSTRYTLQELKEEHSFDVLSDYELGRASKYVVFTKNELVNKSIIDGLESLRKLVASGIPNDESKYNLGEAYKTSLVMTINARSLQNLLDLRTDRNALWEIQDLAQLMFENIPNNHKFLFKDKVKEKIK